MAAAAVCLIEASQRGHTGTKLGQAALAWLWNQRRDIILPDYMLWKTPITSYARRDSSPQEEHFVTMRFMHWMNRD
jgi:hypothetical protein